MVGQMIESTDEWPVTEWLRLLAVPVVVYQSCSIC